MVLDKNLTEALHRQTVIALVNDLDSFLASGLQGKIV